MAWRGCWTRLYSLKKLNSLPFCNSGHSAMSRSGKMIFLLALVSLFARWVFRDVISRFLFHPEGLSVAAGEICLINQTQDVIVADIAVKGGSRMVALLAAGEASCAQSPGASMKGTIKVSASEGQSPFCETLAETGILVKLTVFAAPDHCVWS